MEKMEKVVLLFKKNSNVGTRCVFFLFVFCFLSHLLFSENALFGLLGADLNVRVTKNIRATMQNTTNGNITSNTGEGNGIVSIGGGGVVGGGFVGGGVVGAIMVMLNPVEFPLNITSWVV